MREERDQRDGAARRARPGREPAITRPIGGEVASTWPVMMTSAICSVNGISSQKPRPQASTTCGEARGRDRDAGDDHDQRRDQREDERVGHPPLGPVGQRERDAREESCVR